MQERPDPFRELLSEAHRLLGRLYTRFSVSASAPGSGRVGLRPTIQPVTILDDAARLPTIKTETLAAGGTGSRDVLTVPAGKRWHVLAWDVARSGGDRNIDGVGVKDGTNTVFIEEFTAASTRKSGVLGQKIVMDPGWSLVLSVTGGVTNSGWDVKAVAEEEDAY